MQTTRRLLAKAFCYNRQTRWDNHDGLPLLISPTELKTLQERCRHRPAVELQQAAQELGIDLSQVGLHEC
jgi:hypothetical protein